MIDILRKPDDIRIICDGETIEYDFVMDSYPELIKNKIQPY